MDQTARLLGSAGRQGCKFGCLYCFTRAPEYERCPRLDVLRTRDLVDEAFASEVVQPACDTEFLLVPEWRNFLDELLSTGKIISFATKMAIDGADLKSLSEVNKILQSSGNILHIGITIVRLQDWREIEPHAPSPDARIATLRRLWEAGIPTSVLMRPMFPLVSPSEIEELVARTYRFCYGYLSGPLYLTDAVESYLQGKECPFEVREKTATWQQAQPTLRVVESPHLETHLREAAEQKGRRFFDNNVEAATYSRDCSRQARTCRPTWTSSVRRESVGTVYIFDPDTEEFLLMFHRNLGRWLAPGGHTEQGETPAEAAIREAREELNLELSVRPLKAATLEEGEDFRILPKADDVEAFCTIEEFIHPIGANDFHIHVDSVYVATLRSDKETEKRDKSEVTARDWFSLSQIENLKTFDNVPAICRAILKTIGREAL